MIALVQRVAQARVEIGGGCVAAIGAGALVLVCAEPTDTPAQAERLVDKLLALRIFADAAGKMNLSLRDVGGGLLLVSQFTLAADTSRGNRPGFSGAAPPALGRQLFDAVVDAIGQIEAAFARTNTTGFIHIGAQWATSLAQSKLLIKSGSGFVSPLGHRWVIGGGYVAGLGNTVIGTSQPYGWRDEATVRTAIDEKHNIFAAVAERSVLIGYEALVAAQVIA